MAVFLINICKFNGCGITFPSLGDLIQHIEDTHIDYDPKVVEQKEQAQPACLPLSYVLRFISDAARKESPFLGSTGVELKRKLAIKHHSYSMSSSNRSNTPTGSELDEDEMIVSESEDSNDSWTTEEFSSEFIMRYGSRHSGSGNNGTPGNEKPFACPVPGCKKRYKNVNGIKYHSKNGHKKDGKVRKGYKCHCGKSYKTAQGLKSHALVAHNSSPDSVMTNVATVVQRSASPSQSLGSMSPSSISNMSSSNGSCNGNAILTMNGNGNANCQANTTSNGSIGGGHHHQSSQQQQQIVTAIASSNNNNNNNHHSHNHHQQLLQQQQQQQQQQHHLTGHHNHHSSNGSATIGTNTNSTSSAVASVVSGGNIVRSNIGLISIKSTTKPANLIAANVTASKILKLATSASVGSSPVAPAAANIETLTTNNSNHQLHQQQQHHQQQSHHHHHHHLIENEFPNRGICPTTTTTPLSSSTTPPSPSPTPPPQSLFPAAATRTSSPSIPFAMNFHTSSVSSMFIEPKLNSPPQPPPLNPTPFKEKFMANVGSGEMCYVQQLNENLTKNNNCLHKRSID